MNLRPRYATHSDVDVLLHQLPEAERGNSTGLYLKLTMRARPATGIAAAGSYPVGFTAHRLSDHKRVDFPSDAKER